VAERVSSYSAEINCGSGHTKTIRLDRAEMRIFYNALVHANKSLPGSRCPVERSHSDPDDSSPKGYATAVLVFRHPWSCPK